MSKDDDNNKNKNPWENKGDNNSGKKGRDNPWGSPNGNGNRGGGRGDDPQDIDEMIKNAQEGLKDILPNNMNSGIAVFLLIIAVTLLWLASGFHIVNPGEHGVIQRFGAWDRTQAEEGLGYHFPAPIEQITKVNVSRQNSMSIGYSESAPQYRGSSTNSLTRKTEVPGESLMLTADRNIVDLHMTIQWDIKSAEDFLFKIKGQENTIKKVAESAIREVVGQTEMFTIITTGRAKISSKVQDIIQTNLDEYNSGVNIKQVLIQKAEVHPDVQRAFQDVQSAKQDADNTENIARAYREEILPVARGQATKLRQEAEAYKQSQIAKANGDAKRFKAIHTAYLQGKEVTKERLYIETMENVLSNAEKIIIDSKDGGQGVVPYLPLNELGAKK